MNGGTNRRDVRWHAQEKWSTEQRIPGPEMLTQHQVPGRQGQVHPRGEHWEFFKSEEERRAGRNKGWAEDERRKRIEGEKWPSQSTLPAPISIPDAHPHPDCQMTDPGTWAAQVQTSDSPFSSHATWSWSGNIWKPCFSHDRIGSKNTFFIWF